MLLPSRDGSEVAALACLPWIAQRRVVDQIDWLSGEGQPYQVYAERVGAMIGTLAGVFRPDTVNVLVGHTMLDGAVTGPGGGERPLHIGETYAVSTQHLPSAAQYAALGHIHRPQTMVAPCPARYAGSLLQLDFGEIDQQKSVVLIDARPGRPASIETVSLRTRWVLSDLRVSIDALATLAQYAADRAFFRVTVVSDHPVASLAEQVRELLPNALQVIAEFPCGEPPPPPTTGLGPEELLASFHKERFGTDPAPDLLELFRELYEEASHATA